MNHLDTMLHKAIEAKNNAYAPYSKFNVGACIKVDKNTLFAGCNVENAAYGSTICAEAMAIGAMITAGYQSIKEIIIVTNAQTPCAPCGNCRQLILEFSCKETQIHLCKQQEIVHTLSIEQLLPAAFNKKQLLTNTV